MAKQNTLFRGTNALKTYVVRTLREIFADPTIVIDDRYRYVAAVDERGKAFDERSKISIYRNRPKRIELYPALIISAGPYNSDLVSMGEEREEATENYDANGVVETITSVGYQTVPIKITVYSEASSDDRENLTDLVVQIFRILARGRFTAFGFNKIAVEGESEEESDTGEQIYVNSVTIDCNTDYWYNLDVNQEALITAISLSVLGRISPSSTPIPLHPIN